METDIVLFYYYSSSPVPDGCFLGLSRDIAYRNMFLLPCPDSKIHFEFPMFEDHSYNTICSRTGVRRLIERPSKNRKYIIFRTKDHEAGGSCIIGSYRVRRAYYQETNMFNNHGFVWGIEATPHLIRKGAIRYEGPTLRQGYRTSWNTNEWNRILSDLLHRIKKEKNISDVYSSETNRLIRLFKAKESMDKWRKSCQSCEHQSSCILHRYFARYNDKHPNSNMFSVIHNIYNKNIYSRNVLNQIPKIYLE